MQLYGLIGKKLSHSFSKKYFTEKFKKEGLSDHQYDLFELSEISEIEPLLTKSELKGFNITIPYKQDIIPYIDELDESARKVGAVNVVKINKGKLNGYNSDYYGFKTSLEKWLTINHSDLKALVLGTGGASKAVIAALSSIGIEYTLVSRVSKDDILSYDDISDDQLLEHRLIINTTPLGMSPDIHSFPHIQYDKLTEEHFLYDLVYNPEITQFMALGSSKGAKTKNGLEMLHLQAEKSWEIWSS